MLGRLFGRGKDERSEAVCGECGRTLLAGEWTQRVADDRGDEVVLCSLCAQAHPLTGGERLKVGNGIATAVRRDADAEPASDQEPAPRPETARDHRGENDALWKAIKDRDAEIERLTGVLARAEAERQELLGTVARLKQQLEAQPPEQAAETGPGDSPEAAGEPATPEPVAGALPFDEPQPAAEEAELVAEPPSQEVAAALSEDTAEITAAEAAAEGLAVAETPAADVPVERVPGEEAPAETEEHADVETDAASLTLLQRGVDLLNVSSVPRKVAETTADLGLPGVHVAFDGRVVSATFLWTMGWYRYTVDLESGAVRLEERGYEEREDLRPNGAVRGDGTVQLAPAQISRAAAQRLQQQQPPPQREEREEQQAAPPAGGPEILSKSLLGQRTDDEPPSWDQTRARDFNWE